MEQTVSEPTDEVARAIALLESQHDFPGSFEFRVVIRPAHRSSAVAALLAAAGGSETLIEVSERSSSHGNYLALRIRVHVETPHTVLQVYDVMRQVEGVLTIM
ncbi:MAG: DUF493 family protein [Alphaproteobacteria bacterium]|nr:DUF493 family protein [Alphaproteobacteria bacterium]MCB9695618.1 DUF493 family protein [Alphaproteobacteria bacterium]